ncbi:MAG: hypothetical protein II685_01395, partial [Clostridia bacterium]|nr:hypothetical protein [Clostridia bacterium]
MFEHGKIQNLGDYFLRLEKRSGRSVFFYRINGIDDEITEFLLNYYESTRENGTAIQGKIPNPDGKNLMFFSEMMGTDFKLEKFFIGQSINRWLPRLSTVQCTALADALYGALVSLRNLGKNDNVLKNSYVKFMCWLYYRFESVVSRIGNDNAPKILYIGDMGIYDLYILNVLSNSGCDVVLVQNDGGAEYSKLDPRSMLSDPFVKNGLTGFPDGFGISFLQNLLSEREERKKLYGNPPSVRNCTNAWLSGEIFEDIKKAPVTRGGDPNLFYNAFCRVYGAEDKVTYQNELYTFYLDIKNSKRGYVLINNEIPLPAPPEISFVNKGTYHGVNQMISDLSKRIVFQQNKELEKLMVKAFVDVMLEEAEKEPSNINRLVGRAVHLLCWLFRYMNTLFSGWSMPFVSVFIFFGGCKTEFEVLFLKMLSKLPCDVLILVPNLNTKCILEDKSLFERNYVQSLSITEFPTDHSGLRIATAAYHAERELDEVMYTGTGIYRNHQYSKANSVTLKTMYEEISILWDQELKFRPNFSTYGDTVNVPVIFAKVSGVKDGNVQKYWQSVKDLLTEDTFLVGSVPYVSANTPNSMKYNAASFFRNGKLQREAILRNQYYRYGFLREETQQLILDKIQLLIDSKLIAGTFVNGTEYNIAATALNLQTELVRLIQKYDFTKTNPKFIYINTTENPVTQEDAIIAAFLNLMGFDVVFFVPTGYQTVENYFTKK